MRAKKKRCPPWPSPASPLADFVDDGARQKGAALATSPVLPAKLNVTMSALAQLPTYGQSPWLDFINRRFLVDGSLTRLIEEDGIRGVTSNPAIFEQAIARSHDYDEQIAYLTGEGLSALEIYDRLSVQDVAMAADQFRFVFDATNELDGYVSLEVSPHLAHDTEGTLADARRLWRELSRPNVMIKVPATQAGIPAIQQLLTEGINVNITLLFSVDRYREVAEAYVAAMMARAKQGLPPAVASVASFFVSRVDSLVDAQLAEIGTPEALGLQGQAAVANSIRAYGVGLEVFGNPDFQVLMKDQGARVQRLLWASTSTKDPRYPKTKYVEALIGPDTVNTLPLATIDDYRDAGQPADRLTGSLPQALATLDQLKNVGIDMDAVAQALEDDGIAKFVVPFDTLIEAIEAKRQSVVVG